MGVVLRMANASMPSLHAHDGVTASDVFLNLKRSLSSTCIGFNSEGP